MSSSSDEAAKAAAVAADEAPVAPEVRADETEASPPAVSEVAASETAQELQNEAEKPTTDAKKDADENEKPSNDGEKPADNDGMTADGTPEANAPKKRGRKRKVSVAEETKPAVEKNANGEATKDDGDAADEKKKQPVVKKPKTAPSTPVKVKRKPGRPRKHPKPEESDDDESIEDKMDKKVASLPEDIKAKFGTIVWAKMVGFPYWPALITDPRRLHPRVQESALKELDTKFFVCFYQTRDFYPVLFKNVESWDDSKHDYRSGHPSKDAKAPKRRNNLMSAITEADKDVALPVEERMEGLLKMVDEPESSKEEEVEKPVKRKPGRPLGSKNKKTLEAAAAAAAAAGSGGAPSPAPKAKRGRKKSDATDPGDEQQDKPTKTQTQEEEEEEASTPLSKEEIKAKVASRKTPSKKKPASAEDKAAAAVKKVPKSSSKSEPSSKAELDSKRKKEIELVVPRKSVKSADIREATEEAARKKVGAKEKPKDKGVYKVGNLAQFASKMTRLQANESSKNNDELIQMLTKLFEEKMVYRSDVERSGVAAIIAVLRKSSNPTVAKTASAVRKHLVRVLNTDTETSSKKNKADGEADAKPSKKLKTTDAAPESTPEATPEPNEIKSEEDLSKSPSTADLASVDEDVGPGKATDREPDKSNAEVSIKSETLEKPTPSTEEPTPSTEEPVKTQETITSKEPAKVEASVKSDENDTPVASEKPSPAVKTDATPVATPTASSTPRADPSGDKGRMTCIDMLKKALAPIGEKSADIAREIEVQVYERFSDSSEEYRACARSITFGLKKNAKVRERLSNGSLHALELAYSHEQILKEA